MRPSSLKGRTLAYLTTWAKCDFLLMDGVSPTLVVLFAVLLSVIAYSVYQARRPKPLPRCANCDLEMLHDADIPDSLTLGPELPHLREHSLSERAGRVGLFHCPGCGRRVHMRS